VIEEQDGKKPSAALKRIVSSVCIYNAKIEGAGGLFNPAVDELCYCLHELFA
jgi:hypothetical protein